IESFQGKGYQIKALHWEQSLLQFYSFGKNIAREIDNTKTKVLSYEKLSEFPLKKEFNKSIILEENIFTESELWKINRLRLVNNVPLILETSYIPMNYLPKFKTEELKQKSLYTLLENNHITIVKAREDLKATLANIEEQKLLKIDDNNPLFKTIRYTYDSKESIVEIRKSLIRADYFNFTVEISI
ncbi:MAG: GntR family transcriptional regulator, partial [Halanaerobiales bacterium]